MPLLPSLLLLPWLLLSSLLLLLPEPPLTVTPLTMFLLLHLASLLVTLLLVKPGSLDGPWIAPLPSSLTLSLSCVPRLVPITSSSWQLLALAWLNAQGTIPNHSTLNSPVPVLGGLFTRTMFALLPKYPLHSLLTYTVHAIGCWKLYSFIHIDFSSFFCFLQSFYLFNTVILSWNKKTRRLILQYTCAYVLYYYSNYYYTECTAQW